MRFHHSGGHPGRRGGHEGHGLRECGPGHRGWGHGGPGGFGGGFGHGGGMPDVFGGRGGGGGRGRRMFDGGELRLVLLKLIAEQPRHGYDLIREIEARSGGGYAPSPGVIYPTLTMIEDMGLVEAKAEGSRKAFAITDTGAQELERRDAEVAVLFARLAELGERTQRTSGGPIRRAMGNLHAVIQGRLAHGEADTDMLHQAAAILDEAAQKIERL